MGQKVKHFLAGGGIKYALGVRKGEGITGVKGGRMGGIIIRFFE